MARIVKGFVIFIGQRIINFWIKTIFGIEYVY